MTCQDFLDKQKSILNYFDETRNLLTGLKDACLSTNFMISLPPASLVDKREYESGGHARKSSQIYSILKFKMFDANVRHTVQKSQLARSSSHIESAFCPTALISAKIDDIFEHISCLESRVLDKNSRVLVTGDVNAGKSTLVNALLGQNLLPADQQPCTSVFCEILPCSWNNGLPSIHAIKSLAKYKPDDPSSYDVVNDEQMARIVSDENTLYSWIKIFADSSLSALAQDEDQETDNDEMKISLIDSPGLNHDFMQTMSLFAQQDDIDVIVFVVNAANHLTLSASEFLQVAMKEKDYMFIVVNRFDEVKNKEKCRRVVLQQISQVLPKTFESSSEFIHFVSARDYLPSSKSGSSSQLMSSSSDFQSFSDLKVSLKACIHENRPRTKLLPAKTYLLNVLNDFLFLSLHNQKNAQEGIFTLEKDEEELRPILNRLNCCKAELTERLDSVLESASIDILNSSVMRLGEFVVSFDKSVDDIRWTGIFGSLTYIELVSNRINSLALVKVKLCVDDAKSKIKKELNDIISFSKQTLPNDIIENAIKLDTLVDGTKIDQLFSDICISHVPINVPLHKLLNFWPEIKSLSAYLGTFSAVGGLIYGYRQVLGDLSHITWYVSRNPFFNKKVFLALSGLSLFALSYSFVSDFRSLLKAKLFEAFRERMVQESWVDNESRKIVTYARNILREPTRELQKRYFQTLYDHERQLEGKLQQISNFTVRLDYFSNFHRSALDLITRIEMLSL